MRKKSADYEVGYGKPPRHTRFQKGRSGNPRGRPRRSKNVGTLMREALNAQVEAREQGRVRKMSKLQAGLTHLANRIATGDPRALALLFKLPAVQRDLAEVTEPSRRSSVVIYVPDNGRDPEITARAHARARGRLGGSFAGEPEN